MQKQQALLVRCLSPAGRVLFGTLCTAGIATANVHGPEPLGVAAIMACLVIVAARPAPRAYAKRLALGGLAALALVMPLLFSSALERAALLGSRAVLSLSVALAVASTLTFVEVPGALSALRVPKGLVRVLSAMLSQFALLRATAQRLLLARALRGARRFDIGPDVLAALLVYSAARAERVELALTLRGFDPTGASQRSALKPSDGIPLFLAALGAIAVHASSRVSS